MQPDGTTRVRHKGLIRLGTRFITPDGHDVSVMDVIAAAGGAVSEDGLIQAATGGPKMPFWWSFTDHLPKPEDYVLQRSGLRLEEIYRAEEWEAIGPQMPQPAHAAQAPLPANPPDVLRAAPPSPAVDAGTGTGTTVH